MELIVFIFAAIASVAGGVGVIGSRLPVRNALSLLLVLGSLAVTYLLLAAQFVAVLQVIVYAGAIVVLFLFVIMLLHKQLGKMSPDRLRWQGPAGLVLAAAFLTLILLTIRLGAAAPTAPAPAEFGTAESVGRALFTAFVLPFEVASMILLVGIIAAVVIGRPAAQPAAAVGRSAATPVGASRR